MITYCGPQRKHAECTVVLLSYTFNALEGKELTLQGSELAPKSQAKQG